jgi:hypothetical protein
MNINRQAYDQTSVRIYQTQSNVPIYIVDVNNNDGARVRTMNDRCDFLDIKEIKTNEKKKARSKRT